MTVNADEFIRRFLVHVLPSGFLRIRYYGLLGNRYRKDKLARCRELLGMSKLAPRADEGAGIIATPTKNSPASPSASALFATSAVWCCSARSSRSPRSH